MLEIFTVYFSERLPNDQILISTIFNSSSTNWEDSLSKSYILLQTLEEGPTSFTSFEYFSRPYTFIKGPTFIILFLILFQALRMYSSLIVFVLAITLYILFSLIFFSNMVTQPKSSFYQSRPYIQVVFLTNFSGPTFIQCYKFSSP